MIKALKLVWKLRTIMRGPVWDAAEQAVTSIMAQPQLTYAAKVEPKMPFCPLCGQIPDGDRRMDHARQIAMGILRNTPVRRFQLDFAIALHYFLRKS